jgi:hypothetical protein
MPLFKKRRYAKKSELGSPKEKEEADKHLALVNQSRFGYEFTKELKRLHPKMPVSIDAYIEHITHPEFTFKAPEWYTKNNKSNKAYTGNEKSISVPNKMMFYRNEGKYHNNPYVTSPAEIIRSQEPFRIQREKELEEAKAAENKKREEEAIFEESIKHLTEIEQSRARRDWDDSHRHIPTQAEMDYEDSYGIPPMYWGGSRRKCKTLKKKNYRKRVNSTKHKKQ